MTDDLAARILEQLEAQGQELRALREEVRSLAGARAMLTVDDVAARLGVSRRTVHRMRAEGKIPRGRIIGKRLRWRLDEVPEA